MSATRVEPSVPQTPDQRTARALREALAGAAYDLEHVRAALHAGGEISSSTTDLPVHLRRLPEGTPLGTLIRLFLLGRTVTASDAEKAIAPLPLARLETLGLVRDSGGEVTAAVRIVPHGQLLVTCDRNPELDGGDPQPDYVTGLNAPAVLLASLTVRRPVANALDLGTGNGIQALLAAHHSERVTAVDINPRAVAFARFNAALNGYRNIECAVGDLFEPVRGRRFDLITCNPPYVISPESEYVYRDSGEPGDSLCRRISGSLPEHLAEGGFGQLLISWVRPAEGDWSEPVRPWFEGRGCDAWLLHYRTEDPLTHAAKWLRPNSLDGLAGYPQGIDRWLEHYRRHRIEAIGFGALLLRRREGVPNWTRCDDLRAGGSSASAQIVRVFAAQDFLAAHPDDEAVLDGRFALVPEHRLDQSLQAVDAAWELKSSTLTLTEGITFSGSVDVGSAEVLRALDGRRTLRAVLRGSGAQTPDAVPMIRRLLELGFLELREN